MTTVSSTAAAPTNTPFPTPTPTPRSKHQTSSSGADSDTTAASRPPQSRRPTVTASLDPLSDKATSAFIRKALCTQQRTDKYRDAHPPIEDLLPPLTSRNDVDLQLYAFLAIILREFVQAWYGKITTDETFVAEIIHIVAHCTRALEQRFRKLDLESLILDEIPDLLDKHITAYRTAHRRISTAPLEVDPRNIYHSLCPLPPLSPVPRPDDEATVLEQRENEAVYRQLLVQAVLAVLLPTEDLENPCLTALVGQIFSEAIIGNVIVNKAAQPWMLWEAICISVRVVHERRAEATEKVAGESQFVSISKGLRGWTVHGFFLSIVNVVIFFITSMRLLASAVVASASLPPRFSYADEQIPEKSLLQDSKHPESTHISPAPTNVPILDFNIWSCTANLIELQARMPWLKGFMSLMQHGAMNGPGCLGRLNGTFDRVLSYRFRSLFSPSHLPPLLRTLRGLLFPNNAPGKSSLFPPESDAELLGLRRRAASAVWSLLPKTVGRMYFGGRMLSRGDSEDDGEDERLVDEVEGMLMVLSDEYCNKHLMYSILELVLVRLMPELSDKGVEELWDERLG